MCDSPAVPITGRVALDPLGASIDTMTDDARRQKVYQTRHDWLAPCTKREQLGSRNAEGQLSTTLKTLRHASELQQ